MVYMRNKLAKLALVATFGLGFAFSCSSGDDDKGGLSSSSEGSSVSSSSGDNSGGGTNGIFVDGRDSKSYKWVKIGKQIWLAENLNYAVEGGKCFGEGGTVHDGIDGTYTVITLSKAEIQANCDKYGRLYDWATVMDIDIKYNSEEWGGSDVKHQGICPAGWHIPSYAEWNALFLYVNDVSSKLKSTCCWTNDNDGSSAYGTDEYGFSALPGGSRLSNGSFYGVGSYGQWWISTEYSKKYILVRYMGYYGDIADQLVTLFPKINLHSVRCLQD
jgi:uncharacterized protein (TIGR02145 family)